MSVTGDAAPSISDAWTRRAVATGEMNRISSVRFALCIHALAKVANQEDWLKWLHADQELVDRFREDRLYGIDGMVGGLSTLAAPIGDEQRGERYKGGDDGE